MALPRPGDYITCKCGRCNDVTGHVVMLILDGAIARVECKACGSVHKYREAKDARPGTRVPSAHRVRAGQSREQALRAGKAAAPRPPESPSARAGRRDAWNEAMARHSGETPIPYSMTGAYAARDFLDHPVFGAGEVVAVTVPDKITVLFEEGVKTLRCKTESR